VNQSSMNQFSPMRAFPAGVKPSLRENSHWREHDKLALRVLNSLI